jgi:hypothetical protein
MVGNSAIIRSLPDRPRSGKRIHGWRHCDPASKLLVGATHRAECHRGRVMLPRMNAKHITPILNVSDVPASFAWFEKWGWKKCWEWGTPPAFAAVGSGECEIFLCQGRQGGRGKGANASGASRTIAPRGERVKERTHPQYLPEITWHSSWTIALRIPHRSTSHSQHSQTTFGAII